MAVQNFLSFEFSGVCLFHVRFRCSKRLLKVKAINKNTSLNCQSFAYLRFKLDVSQREANREYILFSLSSYSTSWSLFHAQSETVQGLLGFKDLKWWSVLLSYCKHKVISSNAAQITIEDAIPINLFFFQFLAKQ